MQARLQEIAPENRNHGQSTALSSINRNIARYTEQQAAAPATASQTSSVDTQA